MQIRPRYFFRLLTAFLVRFRVILFGGIVLGLLLFAAFSFVFPRVFAKSTQYIGITGRYHTEELPPYVLEQIGEGLTAISENGEIKPALAERWEHNEDGTEWTFYLNKDKKWHDGTDVNAYAVQYSFEDAQIERPDEYTIKFKLSSPFSPFPAVVSRPTFKKGLLGTGEWKVTNIKLNATYVEEITLRNHDGDKRIIRFYPTEDATKTAFQLGQIFTILDVLDPFPFNNWPGVLIEENSKDSRIVAVFFNNDSDIFKTNLAENKNNKTLRQALSYAIDKDSFEGTRALGPISPSSWAHNPLIKDYAYDEARAKEFLSDYKDVDVDLATTPVLLPVAEKIAEYWEAVGVKTNVLVTSSVPEDYEAFLAIYDMPQDPDQYAIWSSGQTQTNISNYNNPRIDTLLEQGRTELNFEERKKIYLDFQRFLLEDAPAAFLYHPISYTVTRK